jgi:hypothetical protein
MTLLFCDYETFSNREYLSDTPQREPERDALVREGCRWLSSREAAYRNHPE